jgi:hypothetical protein
MLSMEPCRGTPPQWRIFRQGLYTLEVDTRSGTPKSSSSACRSGYPPPGYTGPGGRCAIAAACRDRVFISQKVVEKGTRPLQLNFDQQCWQPSGGIKLNQKMRHCGGVPRQGSMESIWLSLMPPEGCQHCWSKFMKLAALATLFVPGMAFAAWTTADFPAFTEEGTGREGCQHCWSKFSCRGRVPFSTTFWLMKRPVPSSVTPGPPPTSLLSPKKGRAASSARKWLRRVHVPCS